VPGWEEIAGSWLVKQSRVWDRTGLDWTGTSVTAGFRGSVVEAKTTVASGWEVVTTCKSKEVLRWRMSLDFWEVGSGLDQSGRAPRWSVQSQPGNWESDKLSRAAEQSSKWHARSSGFEIGGDEEVEISRDQKRRDGR
jgi:hypothetical protein